MVDTRSSNQKRYEDLKVKIVQALEKLETLRIAATTDDKFTIDRDKSHKENLEDAVEAASAAHLLHAKIQNAITALTSHYGTIKAQHSLMVTSTHKDAEKTELINQFAAFEEEHRIEDRMEQFLEVNQTASLLATKNDITVEELKRNVQADHEERIQSIRSSPNLSRRADDYHDANRDDAARDAAEQILDQSRTDVPTRPSHHSAPQQPTNTTSRMFSQWPTRSAVGTSQPQVRLSTHQPQQTHSSTHHPYTLTVKPPQIPQRVYDGDPVQLEDFLDWFSQWYGAADELDKGRILKTLCVGEAAITVRHIPDRQFARMVAQLRDYHGNEDQIYTQLQRELKNLPSIRDAKSLMSAALTVDGIYYHLTDLRMNTGDNWIIEAIRQKLDPNLSFYISVQLPSPARATVTEFTQAMRSLAKTLTVSRVPSSNQHGNFAQRHHKSSRESPGINLVTNNERKGFQQGRQPCIFCKAEHASYQCDVYKSREERKKQLQKTGRCYRCLKTGHYARNCEASCAQCKSPSHHRLICDKSRLKPVILATLQRHHAAKREGDDSGYDLQLLEQEIDEMVDYDEDEEGDDTEVIETGLAHMLTDDDDRANLATCLMTDADPRTISSLRVQVADPADLQIVKCTAILDSASSDCYIRDDLSQKLRLPVIERRIIDAMTLNGKSQQRSSRVELKLLTPSGQPFTVHAWTTPRIVGPITSPTLQGGQVVLDKTLPQLLIGNELFWEIASPDSTPVSAKWSQVDTRLGPILVPRSSPHTKPSHQMLALVTHREDQGPLISDDKTLSDFWSLEALGIQPAENSLTLDEELWKRFKTTTHFNGERFIVRMLWNGRESDLRDNFATAFHRTRGTIDRLRKKPELLSQYRQQFEEMFERKIISAVRTKSVVGPVFYSPHFEVIKESSTSTKCRIVFDFSSKSKGNISLNDTHHDGPNLLPLLVGIMMRARFGSFLILGDLERAFHQLELHELDKDSTRFVIPKDWEKPLANDNMQVARFNRLPFGMADSPALLNMLLRHQLQQNSELKDTAINIYVDNYVESSDDPLQAVEKTKKLGELMKMSGFNLRQYQCNDATIHNALTTDKQETSMKVLGIEWDLHADEFSFQFHAEVPTILTKRLLLSAVAQQYDPLGLCAPVMIAAKRFIQLTWTQQLTWDERLPHGMVEEWTEITNKWKNEIRFPRQIMKAQSEKFLHVFTDSSKFAYGAAAFLQNATNLTQIGLVYSKSRLAPVKMAPELTIPRLELLGVFVGTLVADFVRQQVDGIVRTIVWSDSSIVLDQIRDTSQKQSIFVQNRLVKIRQSLPDNEFRHVVTADNPADVLSRGTSTTELTKNRLWREGPDWLKNESKWACTKIVTQKVLEPKDDEDEAKVCVVAVEQPDQEPVIGESWRQSVKLTMTKLDTRDPAEAENLLIRKAQFEKEPERKLQLKHSMYVDENGLIRTKSRLGNSDLAEATKHPIYLPIGHPISKQIIEQAHVDMCHARYQSLKANLALTYWVANRDVKKAISSCQNCRLLDAQPFAMPEFGQHPTARVTTGRVFQDCGIDLCGPFRLKNEEEVFVVIYTCLRVRGVHFELVKDTSAREFSLAWHRFCAHHGTPAVVWSDNGTNFVAFETVIVPEVSATQAFKWRFNTPAAPHQGGCWERLVQELKKSLHSTIGRKRLPYNEFATTLAKVQAALNLRPLLQIQEGTELLRPVDFMNPNHNFSKTDGPDVQLDLDDPEFNLPSHNKVHTELKHMHRRLKTDVARIWKRWEENYLPCLRDQANATPQKRKTTRYPRIGEPVLVRDESLPRYLWPLGKITNIIQGRDGIARRIDLIMENGRAWQRPINKCFPLEIVSDEPPDEHGPEDEPEEADVPKRQSIYAFFSRDYAFSNFYASPVTFEGLTLPTAEHHYALAKAKFHGDRALITRVIGAERPAVAKRIMRNAENFDHNAWGRIKRTTMKKIVKAKLMQSPSILRELLSTDDALIAEASPTDLYWGTGLDVKRTEVTRSEKFPGRNELGKILMELREEARLADGLILDPPTPDVPDLREDQNIDERPQRAAAKKQRRWMRENAHLIFLATILVLSLPGASAIKLCHPDAPKALWGFEPTPRCDPNWMKSASPPQDVNLTLYEPNSVQYRAAGSWCRKTRTFVETWTDPGGRVLHRETSVDDQFLSEEECRTMIQKKSCSLGKLRMGAHGLWSTSLKTKAEAPNRVMSLFTSTKDYVSNCYLMNATVFAHFGAQNPTSAIADMSNCNYQEAVCRLAENSILMWDPDKEASCRYRRIGDYHGQMVGNSWHAFNASIHLDVQRDQRIFDCAAELVRTQQGFAVRLHDETPAEPADRQTEYPRPEEFAIDAEASEQATQLRYLQEEVDRLVDNRLGLSCHMHNADAQILDALLLNNPQQYVEHILNSTALKVRQMGRLVEISGCKEWSLEEVEFLPMSETCTEYIPLKLKTNPTRVWYMNPYDEEIFANSRNISAPCTQSHVISIGQKEFLYHPHNGSIHHWTAQVRGVLRSEIHYQLKSMRPLMATTFHAPKQWESDLVQEFHRITAAGSEIWTEARLQIVEDWEAPHWTWWSFFVEATLLGLPQPLWRAIVTPVILFLILWAVRWIWRKTDPISKAKNLTLTIIGRSQQEAHNIEEGDPSPKRADKGKRRRAKTEKVRAQKAKRETKRHRREVQRELATWRKERGIPDPIDEDHRPWYRKFARR